MTSTALTLADRRLSLVAILASAFAVGLTISMATPLVSLMLEGRGYDGATIGLVAAAYSAAILIAGPCVPLAIRRIGPVSTLIFGIFVSAAALAVMPFAGALALVFLIRFLIGAGNAFDWVVSETWINNLPSEERHRGRVVAAYTTVWGAGLAGGPILLSMTGTKGPEPFILAAGILAAAALPVAAARRVAPSIAGTAGYRQLGDVMRAAPLALGAGVVCGFSEASFFALFPVHALSVGFDASQAVILLSAFAAGGVLLQVPIGWLADRLPRCALVGAATAVSLGCVLAVPAALLTPLAAGPLLFLWGGAVAGFYTLGLILLGERFRQDDLTAANTAFILSYTVGMIIGPALSGIVMTGSPSHGLLATIGSVYVLYLVAVALCGRRPGQG